MSAWTKDGGFWARKRVTPEILREVRAVLGNLVWDQAGRLPKKS